MVVHDYLRNTIGISVPPAVLVFLVLCGFGHVDLALGLVIGVAGGLLKSWMLTRSVLDERHAVKMFLFRFLVIAAVFVCGACISVNAFFLTVGGLCFVHVVFIMDQFRSGRTEEI